MAAESEYGGGGWTLGDYETAPAEIEAPGQLVPPQPSDGGAIYGEVRHKKSWPTEKEVRTVRYGLWIKQVFSKSTPLPAEPRGL